MTRRPTRAPIALLMLSAAAACGGDGSGSSEPYSVTDSAGVEIVESYEPLWERSRRIDPSPFVRIGREEEGPYQFASVVGGILLPDTSIAVIESSVQELRLFDVEGRHLQTLGGRGEGAGEFQHLAGVFEYLGDSLAVSDGRLLRTTVFPILPGHPRTISHGAEGGFHAFGALETGRLLLYDPAAGYRPNLPPGPRWTLTEILAVDPADGSTRVIAELPYGEQVVLPDGSPGRLLPARWSAKAVADDGFYWATPDEYEIRFYGGDGALRRVLRRPVEPTPVRPSMVESYIEALLERVRQREGDAAVARYRAVYEEATVGEHVPLFGRAFVDRDQRLWISGPIWPALEDPPSHWSVFSEEGV